MSKMRRKLFGDTFSATVQYMMATLFGPIQTRSRSLKHTVTIDGKQYASKYTVDQIRQRYDMREETKRVNRQLVYVNRVWLYATTARSGVWNYKNPTRSSQVTHNGRFIVFRTWMGGSTSRLTYVSLDTGKKYTAKVINLK
ncbi:hypothetical protein IWT140_01461 [Secundilactobacillus pentosiphilus]|uniref:Uncharacterized protein n=2 Tax=Secundilactobacillus pentosiphilus TaxID=1714682 RepID=A0A1Z5IQ08_9LACO|nr:hypothetical protein IWT140_01461 [Secundilactobacillus pentosiphilus]